MNIDPAATAWLLASTALVLLMTPGLAIFYGGMMRTTGVLNMIMMSFISIPVVTVAWLLVGYSLAFSDGGAGGFLGGLAHAGMSGIGPETLHGQVPELLYATFQLSFAIITAALVSGAIADRAKFGAWMVFVLVWSVAVYAVIAHWVWAPNGWLAKMGVLDYAGGLVVEIVSGASALALALVLGPRIGFKVEAMRPHNLPFVLLGVGLLWFGWFGFNAGSALAANGLASAIFLNTLVAGCLGMLGWLAVEQFRDGKPTTFGSASGVVAGLVAITPSCGTVNTLGAAVVGLVAGVVCSYAILVKFKLNYDDSLDVVGVHFVGGVVGVFLIGLLATAVMTGGPKGLFYGGGLGQLGKQSLAMVVVALYAFAVSFVLGKLIIGSWDSGSVPPTRRAESISPSTPKPLTPRAFTGIRHPAVRPSANATSRGRGRSTTTTFKAASLDRVGSKQVPGASYTSCRRTCVGRWSPTRRPWSCGKTSPRWPATNSSAGSRTPNRRRRASAAFGGLRRNSRRASAGPAAGRGASTASATADNDLPVAPLPDLSGDR